ncbi:pumilio domain member 4 [Perkinsus chesapeaki]|uniref:Pumilio domain member 4 n=1 Tax=Perkinsus chesapeaki TaxID=330153 RepID=A0A7J6N043_PERCH|nr:pumilio domain member 4 [Perkinsus chesapeaki]
MPVGNAAKELFMYNRENWKFNSELLQKNIYQQQKMRVRQVDLYRQDLRDLFGLTIIKMDNYLIMNTILLVLTMEMFYKGRAPDLTPNWLFWPYAITMGAAIVNLLLSIWLSLHASVYAQVFCVRSLTQWLRLPVPSAQEVADAAARLKDFESFGVTTYFRVPVILEQVRDRTGADLPERVRTQPSSQANRTPEKAVRDLTTDWEVFLAHFNLFNLMHAKWQNHEAYSRVTMCWGNGGGQIGVIPTTSGSDLMLNLISLTDLKEIPCTNQMIFAFAYFCLAYYGTYFGNRIAAYAFVLLMTTASYIHISVNTLLTRLERIVMMSLSFGAVLTQCIAVGWHDVNVGIIPSSERSEVLVLVTSPGAVWIGISGVILSMFWQAFFIRDQDGLPYKFSTVWCIDVLGFGVEAIKEVAEPLAQPRLSDKGHLKLPSIPFGGPSNDYRTSRDYEDVLPFAAEAGRNYEPNISDELHRACRRCERSLDRLFRYWEAQREELSDEDNKKLDELKAQFEVQRVALAAALEAEQGRGDATPGTPFNPVEGWVRLEHVTETGETLPYCLNCETGEIQWDATQTFGLRRGISLLPDQLAELVARTRALKEAHKAQGFDMLNDPRTSVRRARLPYLLTWFISIITLLCWVAAVVVLAINAADPDLIADGLLDVPLAVLPSDNHTDEHHRNLAEGWSLTALPIAVNSVARSDNVLYLATLVSVHTIARGSDTIIDTVHCTSSLGFLIDDLVLIGTNLYILSNGHLHPCDSSSSAIALGMSVRRLASHSNGYVGLGYDDGRLYFTTSLIGKAWRPISTHRYSASSSLYVEGDDVLVTDPAGTDHWWSLKSGGRVRGVFEDPLVASYDVTWTARASDVFVGYERESLISVLYVRWAVL